MRWFGRYLCRRNRHDWRFDCWSPTGRLLHETFGVSPTACRRCGLIQCSLDLQK